MHYRQDEVDWSDEDDDIDDDVDSIVPCPHCGEDIYEDAERCPRCGHYISEEDAPAPRKPWWIIIGVALCLILVYLWTVGG